MRTRRLTLKRETLADLSTADLANVAGAAHTVPDPQCVTEVVRNATSFLVSCSVVELCRTNPCTR
ncbi:MAG TPA: hypothetical protein VGX28_06775 [Frankiaceae bacterium]|jgi:hypothetical protein|nr:hypothetical protein [Frankiaceae bacterium]